MKNIDFEIVKKEYTDNLFENLFGKDYENVSMFIDNKSFFEQIRDINILLFTEYKSDMLFKVKFIDEEIEMSINGKTQLFIKEIDHTLKKYGSNRKRSFCFTKKTGFNLSDLKEVERSEFITDYIKNLVKTDGFAHTLADKNKYYSSTDINNNINYWTRHVMWHQMMIKENNGEIPELTEKDIEYVYENLTYAYNRDFWDYDKLYDLKDKTNERQYLLKQKIDKIIETEGFSDTQQNLMQKIQDTFSVYKQLSRSKNEELLFLREYKNLSNDLKDFLFSQNGYYFLNIENSMNLDLIKGMIDYYIYNKEKFTVENYNCFFKSLELNDFILTKQNQQQTREEIKKAAMDYLFEKMNLEDAINMREIIDGDFFNNSNIIMYQKILQHFGITYDISKRYDKDSFISNYELINSLRIEKTYSDKLKSVTHYIEMMHDILLENDISSIVKKNGLLIFNNNDYKKNDFLKENLLNDVEFSKLDLKEKIIDIFKENAPLNVEDFDTIKKGEGVTFNSQILKSEINEFLLGQKIKNSNKNKSKNIIKVKI